MGSRITRFQATVVCSQLMPVAPEPPPEQAHAPTHVAADHRVASTAKDGLAPASANGLTSVGDAALRSTSHGALAPISPTGLASVPTTETIFYDGHCGFCQRTVRWVLKRDPAGRCFRFAPLQGATFQKLVPAFYRATLPDTFVLRTSDAQLLVRSDAFIHILRRLGGPWMPLATVLNLVPRLIRDSVYDFVARIRLRLFARPADTCPVLPPDQRARFDD
ncbi:MAG: DCC1-like thiol-disulfide oxidoreductase family protein [Candidatus Acidiferrales bacterium]